MNAAFFGGITDGAHALLMQILAFYITDQTTGFVVSQLAEICQLNIIAIFKAEQFDIKIDQRTDPMELSFTFRCPCYKKNQDVRFTQCNFVGAGPGVGFNLGIKSGIL